MTSRRIDVNWLSVTYAPFSRTLLDHVGGTTNSLKKIELENIPIPVHKLESFYCFLSQKGYTIPKDKAIDAAKTAAMANSFHPVVEYLDRIASDDNIVPAELDQLGALFWDTKDPLYDAMIRKTVIGAVKRAYEPGCMFRTCLVFKGG